jgi:WD40 repeat protein
MDHDASAHVIGALAWSPDGKYLAESGSDMHIWNVKTRHIVATFGKVDKIHWIATLAWSPDSTMLVSSTNVIQKNDAQNTVHVWKLS